MKQLILSLLTLPMLVCAAQVSLFERFDVLPIKGKLADGGKLVPGEGMEKGALTAKGNGKNFQYIYLYKFPVQGGEKYSLTFNVKTSGHGAGMLAMVLFGNAKGKPAVKPLYFRIGNTGGNWNFKIFDFTVPEGATGAELRLRMVKASPKQQIWVDHLRLAPQGKLDLTAFETTFDNWQFNRHLVFDRFTMRNTGMIVNEWKEAKVGEAFFRATGNNTRFQYPLYIENLSVTPGCNYVFSAFVKASDSFRYPNNGMIIFFFKDANGKPVGQSRYHIRATKGEWKEFSHTFTVAPKGVKLDIGLNMRRMPAKEFIQLDHIRFKKSASNAECSVAIDPDKETLTINNMISADIPQNSIKKIEYIFSDGKTLKGTYQAPTVIPLKDFKDGQYTVEMHLSLADNKVRKAQKKLFVICRNPVWRNNIGILKSGDIPPRPWKELRRKDNAVSTWNNTITLAGKSGIAGFVENKSGIALLDKPLTITVNGEKLRPETVGVTAGGKSRIQFSIPCKGKNWKGILHCTVDYTGFTRFTLLILADKAFELTQCDLDFAVNDMKFLYRSDDSWTAIGAVDIKKVPKWESRTFYNELQFGNEDRGIAFFTDRLYPAKAKSPESWVKVNGNAVKIRMVNAPLKLDAGKGHTVDFALQPYPYRPAEENWKHLRFRAGKYKNLDLLWHTSGHYKYCGSTSQAAQPERIRKVIANKKGKMLYYQFPFYIMDNIPEWSYFEKRWKGIPARAYDLRKKGGMAWKARLTDKDWQDYYLYHFVDHLKNFAWDGVYYDCFGSDVFVENGETFHPVFACRTFQERIYIAQRIHNPESLTVTHTGGSQSGSASTFANVILMGEQYRGQCVKYTYPLEFLTLDEFRYENAVNIGPDRMFLPQYRDQAKISSPKVASHIMGLVTTHNLMLYPNFINKKVELSVRYRQFDFGMEKSTFHPYWKRSDNELPACSNPAVVSSYWKNPDGILMSILNPGKTAQSFTLKLPEGYKVKYYFSPEQGKELTGDKFTLEGYMSALVRLEKK